MRSVLFSFLAVISLASYGFGQSPEPLTIQDEVKASSSLSLNKIPFSKPDRDPGGDASVQVQNGYVRPDSKTRFRRYVKSMVGPVALAKNVASAGWSTWRNSPEEWGDNWEGFGRRFASSVGKGVIKQTTIYGLDEGLKYDSRFYRSTKKDFGSRLGNALISPVTARDRNGKRVLGIPRIVGTYTSSIVAYETWYPSRYDYKDGLRNGTISLGVTAAFNVFKEFVWKK